MKKFLPFALSLSLLALASSARAQPVELITNGSFETGNLFGWTVGYSGIASFTWRPAGAGDGRGFGMAPTAPQDGNFLAWNGFDGTTPNTIFRLHQVVSIPADHTATLSWKHRIQWNFNYGSYANQSRRFLALINDPNTFQTLAQLYTLETGSQGQNPTGDTGWVTQTFDVSQFAGETVMVRFIEVVPEPGKGPAQVELDDVSLTVENNDTDGDGVPNDQDACPTSILDITVVIDGEDTGVTNYLFDDGCTVADLIAKAAVVSENHGQFVSQVAKVLNGLRRDGNITNEEKSTLQNAAAQSDIGKYE